MKRRRSTRRKLYATPEVALLKGVRLRETELLPTLSRREDLAVGAEELEHRVPPVGQMDFNASYAFK